MPLRKRRSQFEFADNWQAEVLDLDQLRRIEGYAGADDDQILSAEGEQAVATGLDHNALFKERGDILGERLGAAHVGNSDLGTFAAQKQGRRQTGFPESHNQNFFAFEIHHPGSILRLPWPSFCAKCN